MGMIPIFAIRTLTSQKLSFKLLQLWWWWFNSNKSSTKIL